VNFQKKFFLSSDHNYTTRLLSSQAKIMLADFCRSEFNSFYLMGLALAGIMFTGLMM